MHTFFENFSKTFPPTRCANLIKISQIFYFCQLCDSGLQNSFLTRLRSLFQNPCFWNKSQQNFEIYSIARKLVILNECKVWLKPLRIVIFTSCVKCESQNRYFTLLRSLKKLHFCYSVKPNLASSLENVWA